jgi:outer membrane biosynthesis protein TonB
VDTGDTGAPDEVGCGLLDIGRVWVEVGTAAALRDCFIPLGTYFTIPYAEPDMNPTDPMAPVAPVAPAEPQVAAPSAPAAAPKKEESAPAPQPSGNVEAVEAPAPTVENMTAMAKEIDNPVLVVTLALIGLLSVGIWKHLGKLADQKNAVELKKLDIEQISAKKGQSITSQPPPCQAANTALEAKLAALEGRVGKVETTSIGLPDGSVKDALEEIDQRIRKLELEKLKKGSA